MKSVNVLALVSVSAALASTAPAMTFDCNVEEVFLKPVDGHFQLRASWGERYREVCFVREDTGEEIACESRREVGACGDFVKLVVAVDNSVIQSPKADSVHVYAYAVGNEGERSGRSPNRAILTLP